MKKKTNKKPLGFSLSKGSGCINCGITKGGDIRIINKKGEKKPLLSFDMCELFDSKTREDRLGEPQHPYRVSEDIDNLAGWCFALTVAVIGLFICWGASIIILSI